MNIVIFGPPGAGKGTQANNLVKEFNLNKVSTGDLLRKEIKKKTKLGIDIENIINKGNLVSDEQSPSSSAAYLTGYLNRTMEIAPIIPSDNAISSLITDVIINDMFGKSR